MIVPDYPIALRGWKSFAVRVERKRASLHDRDDNGTVWWPGEVHRVDSGIYALRTATSTLEVVRDAAVDDADVCIAVVGCWGEVTLNSVSLRATEAYPQALWIPFDGRRRRARRYASRLCVCLDDYGIRTTAIDRDDWAAAFDRAYAGATGPEGATADTHATDQRHVVVEPIDEPLPAASVRRRPAETRETPASGLDRYELPHRPPRSDDPI